MASGNDLYCANVLMRPFSLLYTLKVFKWNQIHLLRMFFGDTISVSCLKVFITEEVVQFSTFKCCLLENRQSSVCFSVYLRSFQVHRFFGYTHFPSQFRFSSCNLWWFKMDCIFNPWMVHVFCPPFVLSVWWTWWLELLFSWTEAQMETLGRWDRWDADLWSTYVAEISVMFTFRYKIKCFLPLWILNV